MESDTDPLKWWKDHEVFFPSLSHLAKKYLLVPVTSSPSERVFSCSGNIVTCHRASLKPDAVDRLVFPRTKSLNEGGHACLSSNVYLKTALLFIKVKKEGENVY